MDIWHHTRDLLDPTDVRVPTLWQYIFKDNSWLELAETHDRCVPVLIVGCGISYDLDVKTASKSANCGCWIAGRDPSPTADICWISIKFANLLYSRLSGDSYETDKPLF